MTNKDFKNSNYVVFNNASIQDVMEAITCNHRGCVIVVGHDWHVVGVVSDGDIRRGMVKGATTFAPIEKVANLNFISIQEDNKEILDNPEEFFKKNSDANVVPVINSSNQLVDILVRGGFYQENAEEK